MPFNSERACLPPSAARALFTASLPSACSAPTPVVSEDLSSSLPQPASNSPVNTPAKIAVERGRMEKAKRVRNIVNSQLGTQAQGLSGLGPRPKLPEACPDNALALHSQSRSERDRVQSRHGRK